MKILHLTLKKKWFDLIAAGEKREEYREIKTYWIDRLLNINMPEESKGENKVISQNIIFNLNFHRWDKVLKVYQTEFKYFDAVKFRNGYSKNARTIMLECKGLKIGEGKRKWGGSGETFIIKLGKVTSKNF